MLGLLNLHTRMMMEREVSHHQACSSYGIDCPKLKQSPNYLPPNYSSPRGTSNIQRNLSELSLLNLLQLAKQLKYPTITTLRLSVSSEEQLSVSQHFGSADQRTTETLFTFTRALAHAIEGWIQTLELGLCLGLRGINTLCPAIRSSRTLKHLSFANSGLGDVMFQVLSTSLQHSQPLQTLNLSGCALTDLSATVITTILKGEDPNARPVPQNLKKTSLPEHRAPKYGHQWRQNVILIGKWSPAPDLGESLISPRTEVTWETTLRKPTMVCSNRHEIVSKPTKSTNFGLVALDLSCNFFTDALSEELFPLLYKRPPLRALNLRCNQMTRSGAKPLLDAMKELNILKLVDMRGNTDESLLGVLEDGEHYTTFSTFQSPFWMDPESLDPVTCNSNKSQPNTPANRSNFTSSPRSSMPEKQLKANITTHHAVTLRGGGGARTLCPQNSTNRANAGGSRNNSPSRTNKTPPKANINTSPLRSNISPSCSGASISKIPAKQWGPNCRQKRYGHCSHHGYQEEDMSDYNDRLSNRRYISAPGKERPPTRSAGISPPRSAWPEKTTFFDQNSYRQTTSSHISPSPEQDYDRRFMSPTALALPGEQPIWDTPLHEFDTRDRTDHVLHRYPSGGRSRAQSAGYNIHRPGYPRDYFNQEFCRDYGHHYGYRNVSASESPSRQRWPATVYHQASGGSQGKRSLDKSPPVIRYHHRCKLLNDVQEQRRNRSRIARASVDDQHGHGHGHGHELFLHQLLPKAAALPDEKKELVEWNNFVNQMTTTLLNLKDGLDQLIGPTEGAAAQQAATKFNQMPSSFFRSGMLRLLERSCKVLNSHVTSLTKRHKNMRHINAENQAPLACSELPSKRKGIKVAIVQQAAGKQEKQHKQDKSQKPLPNVKHFGVQNSNQQQPTAPANVPSKPPSLSFQGNQHSSSNKIENRKLYARFVCQELYGQCALRHLQPVVIENSFPMRKVGAKLMVYKAN